MKIVDDNDVVPQSTSQTSQEAPQSVAASNPIDQGYHEILGLPSACRLYPEGTRLYGRPLKVLDCKALAGINETNADNIINSILRRTVKGLDCDKILVADKLFILLWLRGTSFVDPNYYINFKCSACSKETKYAYNLEKIEVREIDKDFTPDKLTFKLPNNKDEITFAFPTIAEEKLAENFRANCNYIKDADSDIISQCVLIKSINGESKSMLEKYNYLATLLPDDYVYFLSYIEKWSFGIKWQITAICGECGANTPMAAIFFTDTNFWLPRVSLD